MRLFRSLLMFLIGMMGFTVLGATTTHQEQKQRIVVNEDFTKTITYTALESVDSFAITDVGIDYPAFEVKSYKIEPTTNHQFATIVDVGWTVSNYRFSLIPYKEKLIANYNLHFKAKLINPITLIRADC
jgi:hypothetical protein